MMRSRILKAIIFISFSLPIVALAQEPIIYPNAGQSPEQQERDEFECYKWAKSQSGHDPVNPQASAPVPPPKKNDRPVLRNAARAAAIGAATGGIIGGSEDAKTGAAVGAATGGLSGAFQKRDAERQQAESAQQQVTQSSEATSTYDRAFEACMTGRGYTVK